MTTETQESVTAAETTTAEPTPADPEALPVEVVPVEDASVEAAPAAADAPSAPATTATTEGKRNEIFIRGLNFTTRELSLARYIETVAPVQEVHILTNFKGRSKGTAFVTLKDPSLVDKVVEELNGKNFEGRFLEIQRAKPYSELPQKTRIKYIPVPTPSYRFGPPPFYRHPPPPPRYPHPHPRAMTGYVPASRPAESRYESRYDTRYDSRYDTRYDSRYDTRYDSRFVRHQKNDLNPNRTVSKYTVAVLNLPFVAKEHDMADIFDDFEILNPKICKNRAGMSKGIGFVTFTSHEEQERAISTVNMSQVEGRQIHVVEAYLLPEELEEEQRILKENKK